MNLSRLVRPIAASTSKVRALASDHSVDYRVKNVGKAFLRLWWPCIRCTLAVLDHSLGSQHSQCRAALIERGTVAEVLLVRYDELTGKLSDMKEDTEAYADAVGELKDIKTSLAATFPEIVAGYNEEAQAIEIDRKALDELIAKSKELKDIKDLELTESDAKIKQLNEEAEAHKKLADQMKNDSDDISGLLNKRQALNEAITKGGEDAEKVAAMKEQLGYVDEAIAEIAKRAGFTRAEADKLTVESMDEVIKKIKEKYELRPDQIVDLKALKGDAADNIPGVSGIGIKTAIALLKKFENLENIYTNIDSISGKIKEKLVEEKEMAFLSKELATIKTDVKFDFDIEKCKWGDFNKEEVVKLFEEFGFKSLISKIPGVSGGDN